MPHGAGGRGELILFKPPFKSAEQATKPAKIVSARMEERSNAFMGKVSCFLFGLWWLLRIAGGASLSGLKYTEQMKKFKWKFVHFGICKSPVLCRTKEPPPALAVVQ